MTLKPHDHRHAFEDLNPLAHEGLRVISRRNMVKASLAGMAGLSVPALLRTRAEAARAGRSMQSRKSVILLWMAGGPSHIDTWDPKPERPFENRGPFGVTSTKLPGVFISEHLPKQAAMLDKFTLIRSVDCHKSSHTPNVVMQTGNRDARPRTNPKGRMYPAIGSVVSKWRGSNHPAMPAYVAFKKSKNHIAYGGYLGHAYDPFIANDAAVLPAYDLVGKPLGTKTGGQIFHLPAGLSHDRIYRRRALADSLDRMRRDVDASGMMTAMDSYDRQAVDLLIGKRAQNAFDLTREPQKMRDRYGEHLWCQQALLARRLVESGVSFVTIDLSYHTASGTWDTHGDNIPPYGGIKNGLGPLLPLFDHLVTTLVGDLDERGLLDEVLVIAMGEFGRSPTIGTQGSTDGRNHWPVVMSMALAGGGYNHGQVIGASLADGSRIKDRPVTPGDIAATIYHHMDVPLDSTYLDFQGRPLHTVIDGKPIGELL